MSKCFEPVLETEILPKPFVLRSQRLTFANRCRQAARSHKSGRLRKAATTSTPIRRRRRRRCAKLPKSICCEDDDSKEEESVQLLIKQQLLISWLATGDAGTLVRLQFSTHAHKVRIEGLQTCTTQALQLSGAIARALARDSDPSSCVGLQNGRLAAFEEAREFQLRKVPDGWLLVADSHVFFNFVLRRWQPLHWATSGPYAAVSELLYVAFVPEQTIAGGAALFVKLGYRELADSEGLDQNGLIGYVEKKSQRLRLTNVRGAGLFVFPAPPGHAAFARPCRAAEASLKTEILHSNLVRVRPSGHLGDVGTFSTSLEYFFVEEPLDKEPEGPLIALTRFLRDFTGNPELQPQCAQASDGGLRRGRKRLQPWPDAIQVPLTSKRVKLQIGAPSRLGQAPSPVAPPKSMHAALQQVGGLRSRAKLAQLGGTCSPAQAASHCTFHRHSA